MISKIDRSVFNSVEQKINAIRSNPFFGEPVAKWRIPRRYVELIAVDNLHWVALANFWRMLYTLRHIPGQSETSALILDILSHPDYDKLMGYNKDRQRR